MTAQSFDEAFERVKQLAATFRQGESHYLSSAYDEASTRKDFIDKFFIALGWDVNHETQTNPYEQEVKVERGGTGSERRRRADYAFLAPNFRDARFYVEAKKPSLDLDNQNYYFQTVRYGWNSNTPVAVLTDFEQFRILDCRYEPQIDAIMHRAVRKYHYTDYTDRDKFAEIYWLFSRQAVSDGSLEKFAAALPKPSGKARQQMLFAAGRYQSVDESFLQRLDEFRESLARSFKNKNPQLDSLELTEITQRALDRLVFMRFLEDKLIEAKPIVENLGSRGPAWQDFIAESRRLDQIYNGIVFKKHGILDAPGFRVDERVFEDIRDSLAHINSPYDFNSIPIHILGSIYERFLGKTIIATDKRARVEEKPEVRKAGGVYYTPEYIVRYIVENTVGKLIAGKTPEEIAAMRFADIACGSGSFLLGVYDLLLRHHTAYYNKNKANRAKGVKARCSERGDGSLQLSLWQKRQILLNNIYGVDIDAQAVEVAQLSLYLKLLEEETTASTRGYQLELREALLPSLSENIVCGNSLIGWDIASGKLFADEEERKLNPMSFEDVFPQVKKRGGFDAIVGNPPYGAEFNQHTKAYLNKIYQCQSYQLDSYLLFLERAIRMLIKPEGFFGMIIPNPWLTNIKQDKIRKFVIEQTSVREIVHFKFPVFPKVTVDTEIVILQKTPPKDCKPLVSVFNSADSFLSLDDSQAIKVIHDQSDWQKNPGDVINVFLTPKEKKLIERVKRITQSLDKYFEINVGIKPYQAGKGIPPQTQKTVKTRPFDNDRKESELHRQYLRGADIARYLIAPVEMRFLKYGPWLAEPRPAAKFDAPVKLFMRQTGDSLIAALDYNQLLCLNNMHVLVPRSTGINPCFFLGVINSKLLNWFYQTSNPEVGEALAEVKRTHVANLPIRTINSSEPADRARHDQMAQLVEQMLAAKKQLAAARTDRDRAFYEKKCAALDGQVDRLVYELYELTDGEITLVEAG